MSYSPGMLERMRIDLLDQRIERALENNRSAYNPRGYQITLVGLRGMLVAQNCNCAICKKDLEGNRWVIEHDHTTGRVRGLTCNACNSWLGANEKMVKVVYAYLTGAK